MSTKKPIPKRVRRDRTEEILREAIKAFAEKGFRGTTTKAIASSVGLSEPGLLHYFPSKAHLLKGVLTFQEEQALEAVQKSVSSDEKTDLSKLLEGFEKTVAQSESTPGLIQLFTVLVAESIDADHPAHDYFVKRYQKGRQLYKQSFSDAIGDQLPSETSMDEFVALVMAVWDGLQIQWLLDPDEVDLLSSFRLFSRMITAFLEKQ